MWVSRRKFLNLPKSAIIFKLPTSTSISVQVEENEENLEHGFWSHYNQFSKIPYSLEDMWSSLRPIYIKCPDLYITVKFGFAYFDATIMI